MLISTWSLTQYLSLVVNERGTELRDGFPWASLGSGKVVDVGGGSGHISIKLARVSHMSFSSCLDRFVSNNAEQDIFNSNSESQEFPSLRFVVQDNSPVQLGHGEEQLGGRVNFQPHDFFELQPVHDASAFLLRQILHNHNNEDSIKIIRALVPALEKCGPATPVLISDIILPEYGTVTRFEERLLRQIDLCMMVGFGSKQRSRQDWAKLFNDADPRFQIVNAQINPLGIGLLQVHLMS